MVAVVVPVWLVSAQVRLPAAQGMLIGVLVALILASAFLGMLLAARLTPSARTSVVMNVPMRDFARASGIAAAASGPAAAAPLGSYGVLVMASALWSPAPAGRPRSSGRTPHDLKAPPQR
jgi:hypothetical protein